MSYVLASPRTRAAYIVGGIASLAYFGAFAAEVVNHFATSNDYHESKAIIFGFVEHTGLWPLNLTVGLLCMWGTVAGALLFDPGEEDKMTALGVISVCFLMLLGIAGFLTFTCIQGDEGAYLIPLFWPFMLLASGVLLIRASRFKKKDAK